MYLNEGWIDWPATKTTKPYPEPWQQTLLEAAEYIRRYGWCQGTYGRDNGPVCIMGAVIQSRSEFADYSKAREAIIKTISDECPPFWNDRPKRKRAEVLNALEKAANY